MIHVGLLGARGYVGEELLRMLLPLEDYQVVFVGSRSLAGQPVLFQQDTRAETGLVYSELEPSTVVAADADVDVWVVAQSNGVAPELVTLLKDQPLPEGRTERRFIDVSADHRFHADWVYGLPERNHAQLVGATQVANPGCYATAGQLALLPVLTRIQEPPVLFGVSGFSGAGRTPNEKNDPLRLADNLLPYALSDHLHQREVSHQLGVDVRLIPHVANFFRGISMTLSVRLSEPTSQQALHAEYERYYREAPLIEITKEIPEIQMVAGTNRCRIGGFSVDRSDPQRLVLVSTLDNLRKGAATQAVQNMNLMFELDSTKGLLT